MGLPVAVLGSLFVQTSDVHFAVWAGLTGISWIGLIVGQRKRRLTPDYNDGHISELVCLIIYFAGYAFAIIGGWNAIAPSDTVILTGYDESILIADMFDPSLGELGQFPLLYGLTVLFAAYVWFTKWYF